SYSSDFVSSIIRGLDNHALHDAFGGRAVGIVSEIYAKTKGGRRGSKSYKVAEQEFYDKWDEGNDE
ncbi:MAG: hypothetical protein ACREGR_01825, partial [Minisyncoccia bacterium]